MISALDFADTIEDLINKKIGNNNNFKIGTIASVDGKPKILFDGENTASGKGYSFLSSYTPVIGDRVLLLKVSGTYVVVGSILTNTSDLKPHIVEKGGTVDNNYVKYSDGTMICYMTLTTLDRNNPNRQSFVYPENFIRPPVITLNHYPGISPSYMRSCLSCFINSFTDGFMIQVLDLTTVGATLSAYATAIGRWKE